MNGRHADILEMLERQGIPHYSFLDDLAAAVAESESIQEVPHDPQHPSAAFGRRMARSMIAQGFDVIGHDSGASAEAD
jgi:hypothetical protein